MRVQKYKHTIETRIEKSDPLLLHQVQRSHHLADNAIDKLSKISQTLTDNKTSPNSVDSLIRVLEEVMSIIQQSREQIGINCASTFLSSSTSSITASLSSNIPTSNVTLKLQQGFYPPLPTDVILEYTVDEAKIRVSLYTLSFSASKNVLHNTNDPKNRTFTLPSKPGEVGFINEQFSTVCKVNFLSEALKDLTSAFKRCSRLRDKLQLHRQYL
jgi:hypothetical protein